MHPTPRRGQTAVRQNDLYAQEFLITNAYAALDKCPAGAVGWTQLVTVLIPILATGIGISITGTGSLVHTWWVYRAIAVAVLVVAFGVMTKGAYIFYRSAYGIPKQKHPYFDINNPVGLGAELRKYNKGAADECMVDVDRGAKWTFAGIAMMVCVFVFVMAISTKSSTKF